MPARRRSPGQRGSRREPNGYAWTAVERRSTCDLQRLPLLRGLSARSFRRWSAGSTFAAADLLYLANLCHDCGACYYACQYAPPHEFELNIPRIFAQIRAETYSATPGRASSPCSVRAQRRRRVARHRPRPRALPARDLLLPGAGGAVRGASGRRLLQGPAAWRDGLDVRRWSRFRAAGARRSVSSGSGARRVSRSTSSCSRWRSGTVAAMRCASSTSRAAATAAPTRTSVRHSRGGHSII